MKLTDQRYRWFRFRLRTLLIVVAFLAIPFGWRAERIRSEKLAIAWVEEMGGEVNYKYRSNKTLLQKAAAMWFGKKKVDRVYLTYQHVTDVSQLANLKEATLICLQSTTVRDITSLECLENLQMLDITNTEVPREQVEKLKELIPNCEISYSTPEQLTHWEELVENWRVSVNRKD